MSNTKQNSEDDQYTFAKLLEQISIDRQMSHYHAKGNAAETELKNCGNSQSEDESLPERREFRKVLLDAVGRPLNALENNQSRVGILVYIINKYNEVQMKKIEQISEKKKTCKIKSDEPISNIMRS